MNYRPSSAAKSLATGKSNILGITYRFNKETPSRNMELSFYINLLVEQLNRMGYDVIFIPVDPVSENSTLKHNIDGIIAIDLSNEDFNNFSNNYMVPIVAVDMLVNDALFYQVYSNLPNAINAALSRHSDAVLVMESYLNEAYMDYITGVSILPGYTLLKTQMPIPLSLSVVRKQLLSALISRFYSDHM